MAKKTTLFSYTRKRIFDTLMARFTGFTVKDINSQIGSEYVSSLTFQYFGKECIRIIERQNGDLAVDTWRDSGRKYEKLMTLAAHTCTSRADADALIERTFAAFPETQAFQNIRRMYAAD